MRERERMREREQERERERDREIDKKGALKLGEAGRRGSELFLAQVSFAKEPY